MELLKKLAQPTALGDCMSNRSVLRFGTRAGDSGLPFGRPDHQRVTEEDTVA